MGEKIFSFAKQVLVVFAVDVCFLLLMVTLVGEEPEIAQMSSLFRLGGRGLAAETLLQFLLTALIVTGLNQFFMSDCIFKKVRVFWRMLLLLLSVLLFISGCILAFGWFPVDNSMAWLSFLLTFFLFFLVSSAVTILKKRMEDRKYEEQLRRYREKHEKAAADKEGGEKK